MAGPALGRSRTSRGEGEAARRVVAPEPLDQPFDRDDPADLEGQVGEDGPLLGTTEVDEPAAPVDRDRAEQAHADGGLVGCCPPSTSPGLPQGPARRAGGWKPRWRPLSAACQRLSSAPQAPTRTVVPSKQIARTSKKEPPMSITTAPARPTTYHEAIEDFRARFSGAVLTVADEGYDTARMGWNLALDQHPAVIVVAATTADIADRRALRPSQRPQGRHQGHRPRRGPPGQRRAS